MQRRFSKVALACSTAEDIVCHSYRYYFIIYFASAANDLPKDTCSPHTVLATLLATRWMARYIPFGVNFTGCEHIFMLRRAGAC